MKKEDVIIEAYDLIKGEVNESNVSVMFIYGIVEMTERVIGMLDDEQ